MMESNQAPKKRKHKRALIMQKLMIDGKSIGQAIDLSIDGMYVTTRVKFAPRAVIDIRFQLEDQPLEVKARVLYQDEGIGIGVRFLALKTADAERIKAYLEKASISGPVPFQTRRKQILMIDDSDFYQTLYQQRLLSEGYSFLAAYNGIEGLKILARERPDLILLDLIMDGMDGYRVLQIIKSEPKIRDIPVVIFSVRGTLQEINRAIQLGATDYIVKATTTPLQVMEKIKKVLHHPPSVS
ncbi:MAG: response regulator [Nitrospirae bacterium]|nr:response regulator [Nitrospirota bacterium]